ncbi:MAG: ribonuclease Z [Candidatus Aenigmarchaeota archaeon]|nr:ribonuclease Z [Candidatus Aenigmarchaeota archaeon]
MEVVFVGSGEAFDENRHNISILVNSKTKLLLDCGYNVPQSLWEYNSNPNFLDGVYISHFHADHYYGVLPLILRMEEDGRKKEFTIIGQKGVKESILNALELSWKGWSDLTRYPFNIEFVEIGGSLSFNELELSFALTSHVIPNYAIKVALKERSMCYSGDGAPTEESKNLYQGTNLLAHELCTPDKPVGGHATVKDIVKLLQETKLGRLALVHIMRTFLKRRDIILNEFQGLKSDVFIPDDLQEVKL